MQTSHSSENSSVFSPNYLGTINTPTAQVLDQGHLKMGVVQGSPERPNPYPGVGFFGSTYMGVGLFEGFEGYLRLDSAGDLHCDQYASMYRYGPFCKSTSRDLSVALKYKLPLTLPWELQAAVGATDYGGAATNYRSTYGVMTREFGALQISAGTGFAHSPNALLTGPFMNARYVVNNKLSVMSENDSRASRVGFNFGVPLSAQTKIAMGWSKKVSGPRELVDYQFGISFQFDLDGRKGTRELKAQLPLNRVDSVEHILMRPLVNEVIRSEDQVIIEKSSHEVRIRQALRGNGFVAGKIFLVNETLFLQAEPISWRINRLEAAAKALSGIPLSEQIERIQLTLTYQNKNMFDVNITSRCLKELKTGQRGCEVDPKQLHYQFSNTKTDSKDFSAALYSPSVELGFSTRHAVGTEYGYYDYSLAGEVSIEQPLASGLWFQTYYTVALKSSDDFNDGKVFGTDRYRGTQKQQQLISYWTPVTIAGIPGSKAIQLSSGRINYTDEGQQLESFWMSPTGRWRLYGTAGNFKNPILERRRQPLYASLRYSLVPGKIQLEATSGQFYNNDQGYRLATYFWFGDTRFQTYFRKTYMTDGPDQTARHFAGFTISFPFGSGRAYDAGPISIRLQDRLSWGLETKILEKDNLITTGYGWLSRPRHGLFADVLDFDRVGLSDIQANSYQFVNALFSEAK